MAGAVSHPRTGKTAVASGRGRPRGTGARAQEVLARVREKPGITIVELAERMKMKPNYLYRILPPLEKDGKVTKRGRGYHPRER